MSLGPVMLDLEGPELTPRERELLGHPRAGGVILFARNFESPGQVAELVAAVHGLRHPPLLVAVDQEGGRVQRFRDGFTRLPAARRIGARLARAPEQALELAREAAWLMAAELRSVGVDFSFAPVLDLHRGVSRVIDDRAYHGDPEAVARLARAAMGGMQAAGMAAVGKHFPGHGSVAGDSHETLPEDPRDLTDIEVEDLVPFTRLVHAGLPAVMPAHVVYPAVDRRPAGYSRRWVQDILRRRLGFEGVVFSDDLSMAGAAVAGDHLERARMARAAGCDMLLVCNAPGAAARVLEGLDEPPDPVGHARLVRMHGRDGLSRAELERTPRWRRARALLAALDDEPELSLGDDNLL